MPLTVETGSGSASANSYVSLAEARTLAVALGVILSPVDADAESALARATTYLETFRDLFQGHRTNGNEQALAWPRKLAAINGAMLEEDAIPLLLKKAQVTAASLIGAGTDLFPVDDGKFITEDTVDVITTKYSEKLSRRGSHVDYPIVNAYLSPLLSDEASATGLRKY